MNDLGQPCSSAITTRPGLTHFAIGVAGFSFWFLMAVPFASHRESYAWLASVYRGNFLEAVGWTLATTWRPLAQTVTWLGFAILNPHIFPTSVPRQALLQMLVYGAFLVAWLIIYSTAPQHRTLSLIAFVAGAVFFPGYIHLFHIYGHSYAVILLILALMLKRSLTGAFKQHDTLLAAIAITLVLWHPFATVVFLGFYVGRYLDVAATLGRRDHLTAWTIIVAASLAVIGSVASSPNLGTTWAYDPMAAFVISYRTNEINVIASLVAWGLAYVALLSTAIPGRPKLALGVLVTVLGAGFFLADIPLLLLWILVVCGKLAHRRSWGLLVPLVVAALLPYGGRIGGPVYGLFPIVLATFVTSLGWTEAETRLCWIDRRHGIALVLGLGAIVLAVRAGISVPVFSPLARPLLAERERTFQFEHALAWLSQSSYCGRHLAFAEAAGNPIDSVESAITRRHRPPAGLDDVVAFWETALRCKARAVDKGVVVITFGGQELAGASRVFELPGLKAGPATAWIRSSP